MLGGGGEDRRAGRRQAAEPDHAGGVQSGVRQATGWLYDFDPGTLPVAREPG